MRRATVAGPLTVSSMFFPDWMQASGPLHIDDFVVTKTSEDFYLQKREKVNSHHSITLEELFI
jgi:hypothetical protein